MTVGIFGAWRPTSGDSIYEEASEYGRMLGARGHRILTGGYSGVMEAACKGARSAGATTIGVTCPELDALLPLNPWVQQRISARDLQDRLATCMRLVDAAVFLPGRTGTMSELALASELREKQLLRHPLILAGEYWESFFKWQFELNQRLPYPSNGGVPDAIYKICHNAEEALRVLEGQA